MDSIAQTNENTEGTEKVDSLMPENEEIQKPETQKLIKNFSGKLILKESQLDQLSETLMTFVDLCNTLVKFLLHGYEDHDYEDFLRTKISIPNEISSKELLDEIKAIRESVINSGYSRSFAMPILGNSNVGKSVKSARESIIKFRAVNVLPIYNLFSNSDRYSVMQEVFGFVKSYIECDQRTRQNYINLEKQVQEDEKHRPFEDAKDELYFQKSKKYRQEKLERSRKFSTLTLYSENRLPGIYLGENYNIYDIQTRGNILEVNVKSGALKGRYIVAYGAGNKVNELHNLKITRKRSKKGNISFIFSFLENGKRYREMILSEPRIQILSRKNGTAAYFAMPLSIEVPFEKMFMEKNVYGKTVPSDFNRRFPKEIDGLESQKGLKCMAIDLGIARSVSFCIMEVDHYGPEKNIKCYPQGIEEIDCGYFSRGEYGEIVAEKEKGVYNLIRLMKNTRAVREDKEPLDVELIKRVTNNVEEYVENVKSLPEDMRQWTRPGVWLAGKYLENVISDYRKLKALRSKRCSGISDELVWIDYIDKIIRAQKVFNFTGSDPKKDKKGFLGKYYEHRRNVKSDYIKKVCRAIVDIAKKNDCKSISVEDLRYSPRKNDRRRNRMWNLWSPMTLLKVLIHMSRCEGVDVVKIDPSNTSQSIFGKGVFGHRPNNDRNNIYYLENGELHSEDADINAARNIGHRALTRHIDQRCFKLEWKSGKIQPVGMDSEDNEEKPIHPIKMSKNLITLLEFNFGEDWISALSEEAIEDIKNSKEPIKHYVHDGRLISGKERRKLFDDIERSLENACVEVSR